MRLIDADTAFELAKDPDYGFDSWNGSILEVKGLLSNCPTIEAKPVVHAHWVAFWNTYYMSTMYCCSKCGNNALTREETMFDQVLTGYCPYCGAQMDEESENKSEKLRLF